jgi:hypothetical protein
MEIHLCDLTLVLNDFEHLFKRRYYYFSSIWRRVHLGSIYLKWAYDKHKFKLKRNNYGFKRNSELNQICSKFVAEVN